MAASADAPPAAPTAPTAPAAPTAPDSGPAAASTGDKPVDPQAQVVQSGTPDSPSVGIPALNLKEDISEACAGAVVLPFKIGSATTLKELLVKLHLMDALTDVCADVQAIELKIEELTGPGGVLDLDLLLH